MIMFTLVTNTLGLPQGLLSALCHVESSHNVRAIHVADGSTDSLGICQIKLETAKMLGFKGTKKQLMNPYVNIIFAGKYLSHQMHRYDGRIEKAVIAYNSGHYSPRNTLYLKKVLKALQEKR